MEMELHKRGVFVGFFGKGYGTVAEADLELIAIFLFQTQSAGDKDMNTTPGLK